MKRHLVPALGIPAVALLLTSCPNPLANVDLQSQIQDEVRVATASEHVLTVETDAAGVVSPSGDQTVKDGIPISLSATAFPAYGVIGWKQTAGSGTVTFARTASGVTASVTGGNATIAAIFVEKPRVLYSTPIGNNISKNTTVAAFFSKQIDFDTINMNTFRVLRNGSEQITAGSFSATADGKSVRFDPSSNLDPYCNYVISVASSVKADLNLADYTAGNTIITDGNLLMASEYTAAFMTNNAVDSIPPVSGTFAVKSLAGDAFYTGSSAVLLDGISASDESGVSSIYVKNESDAGYVAYTYDPANPSIRWSVPAATEGTKNVDMVFEDPYGNKSTPDVVKSIIVDVTGPSGSLAVNSTGGFVPAGNVTLTLSASDPDVVASTIKGSGESSTGSDTVNRKQMRFANTSAGIATASWEAYATSKLNWPTLYGTSEGLKNVFAQFCDGVGNLSPIYTTQVYQDVTAPTGGLMLANESLVTKDRTVVLGIWAWDGSGSGVDKVQIDGSSDLENGSGWSATGASGTWTTGVSSAEFAWPADGLLNVTLSNTGDGLRTIRLKVKDKVGNVATVSQPLTLDTTPPSGGALSINGGAASVNTTNVTLTVTAGTDTGSGVAYMGFSNTTTPPSSWVPFATTAAWVMNGVPSTNSTVYVWFMDGAGNYSATQNASDTIFYDVTAPAGTISATPSITKDAVTIACSITGAVYMKFSNNGAAWSTWEAYATSKTGWSLVSGAGGSSTNGTRTVYAQFSDGVGGTADSGNKTNRTTTVTLDTTAPVISSPLINGGAAWTNAATVTFSLTASDAYYAAGSLSMRFSNDGATWSAWQAYATSRSWDMTSATYGGTTTNTANKYVYVQVQDPLGNVSQQSDYIGYDTAAPGGGAFTLNAAALFTNSPLVSVNVGAAWTDPVPTASTTPTQMCFSNNGGTYSAWETYAPTRANWDITSTTYGGTTTNPAYKYVYMKVRDGVGNESTYAYDSIYYDTVAPTGTVSIAAGAASTTTTYVTLSFTFSDSISSTYAKRRLSNDAVTWTGWETYTASRTWYLLPENGTKTVYVQFQDGAGNTSGTYTDTITLASTYASITGPDLWGAYDTTPPDITAARAYMSTAAIDGGVSPYPMSVGSVLVFRTNTGLYGKMVVTRFDPSVGVLLPDYDVLTFDFTFYASNGSTVALARTSVTVNSNNDYYFDLETSTASTSAAGADFRWYASGAYGALVPQNGAYFDKWN